MADELTQEEADEIATLTTDRANYQNGSGDDDEDEEEDEEGDEEDNEEEDEEGDEEEEEETKDTGFNEEGYSEGRLKNQQIQARKRFKAGLKPRIGFVGGVLMILVALGIDGTQVLFDLIPFIGFAINFIIDIGAWLTFYIWFKALGMSFGFSAKWGKAWRGGGGQSVFKNPIFLIAAAFGIELIPIINALPAWTAAVILTIMIEYGDYIMAKAAPVLNRLGMAKAS